MVGCHPQYGWCTRAQVEVENIEEAHRSTCGARLLVSVSSIKEYPMTTVYSHPESPCSSRRLQFLKKNNHNKHKY